jgi:hypothetical protein
MVRSSWTLRPLPTADARLMRVSGREASGGHKGRWAKGLGGRLGVSRRGGSAEVVTEAAEMARR